jgi:hypothetical protein
MTKKEISRKYRNTHREEIRRKGKEYHAAHKEKINRRHKKYRDTHKEKLTQYYTTHKEERKEYYKAHKEERKRYRDTHKKECKGHNYRRLYGLTLDDYNRMFEKQNGHCAICGTHISELAKPLSIDHDHKTGKIRGLLCNSCNFGLGHFNDDVNRLSNAAQYLRGWGDRQ